MEPKVYKLHGAFYVVRVDSEHYIFWNHIIKRWENGVHSTWIKKLAHDVRHTHFYESSWLELLITTGQTKEQAIDFWEE